MSDSPIQNLKTALDYSSPSFRRAQKRIGAMMVDRTVGSFRAQARGGIAWPDRRVPNIAGILTDLMRRPKPKDHRFYTRPALIDNGTLMRTIVSEISGRAVTFGSRQEYASRMQRGEPTTIVVTSVVQRRLIKFLSRYPGKFYRTELGWLLKRSGKGAVKDNKPFDVTEVTITPKARPFVMFTDTDRADAMKIIGEEVLKAVRSR